MRLKSPNVQFIREYCKKRAARPFSDDPYSWRLTSKLREKLEKSPRTFFHIDFRPMEYMEFLRKIVVVSPFQLMELKKQSEIDIEKADQIYNPERHRILGNDLATAHFVVFRNGRVRFVGQDSWVTDKKNHGMPTVYSSGYKLQDIDCTNMNVYFDGLLNFSGLKFVKTLSFRNCMTIDDWSMNRISSMFPTSLESFDIRNCPHVTFRGIGTLFKCKDLKHLYISNIEQSDELQLVCLMLEELNPYLEIHSEKQPIVTEIK